MTPNNASGKPGSPSKERSAKEEIFFQNPMFFVDVRETNAKADKIGSAVKGSLPSRRREKYFEKPIDEFPRRDMFILPSAKRLAGN